MKDHERVELLESYTYCGYIMGDCVLGYGSNECRARNPVACRTCRQRNEQATK